MKKNRVALLFFTVILIEIHFGITVWVSWEGEEWYRSIAQQFSMNTGIPVQIVQLPSLEQKLVVALRTKDSLPDVCLIKSDQFPVVKDAARKIDQENLQPIIQRLIPVVRDTYSFENVLFALPFYADVQVLFLQKKVFELSNIAFPAQGWTVEDLEVLLKQLHSANVLPMGWGFKSPYIFLGLQEGFGSSFRQDGSIEIRTPENYAVLAKLRNWAVEGWIKDYPQRPELLRDFSKGAIAMIPQGSYLIASLIQSNLPFHVVSLPEPWKPVIDSKAWVVFNPNEEIFAFIAFVVENMASFCNQYVKIPLVRDVKANLPFQNILESALENGFIQPSSNKFSTGYWPAMEAFLELYLTGKGELDPLISTAQHYIDQIP